MIPGSKAHAFHACMKKHGFMTRKIRASSHFSQKNARIASILGLRKHIVRSNPCIIHLVILSLLYICVSCLHEKAWLYDPQNTSKQPFFAEKCANWSSHRLFHAPHILPYFFHTLSAIFPHNADDRTSHDHSI